MAEGAGFRAWVDGVGMKQGYLRRAGWVRGTLEALTERQPRGGRAGGLWPARAYSEM